MTFIAPPGVDGNYTGATSPYATTADDAFMVGPQAEGRPGDVLFNNGVIQAVISQPGKSPGVGSFGGNIIDVGWVSGSGRDDHFGVMLPMINVEWTINGVEINAYQADSFSIEKLVTGQLAPLTSRLTTGEAPVIVVRGIIDTYEFLDIDFLEPVAAALTDQTLAYDARFDDMNDPFAALDLRTIDLETLTIYTMPKGEHYIKIETVLFNRGEADVALPFGDFINASGELQLLIPGQGFSPSLTDQILNDTPAVIYAGQPGVDISYGYFYDLRAFVQESTLKPVQAPDMALPEPKRLASASLSYAGVTGMILGESFPKIFPLGSSQRAAINTTIPAEGHRIFTRYFVLGDGSAGSVLDVGLQLLQIPTRAISGTVIDASGQPVPEATVAMLNEAGKTLVTYRSDAAGRFSGYLSKGSDQFAAVFGSGRYEARVEKAGYHYAGDAAGVCSPASFQTSEAGAIEIACVLGHSGMVQIAGPMLDVDTGVALTTRLTVLGRDPSPDRVQPGLFHDPVADERPYGVVALHYIDRLGQLDATQSRAFRLEPGEYLFAYSRGLEYELRVESIKVSPYGMTTVQPGALRRVVQTPGLISADFHIHAAASPDSSVSVYQRAIAAAGEGLDVLHSSDHDYLFDYAPIVRELEARGAIAPSQMATMVGNEITPNHLGHIHAFPLARDETKPAGGAIDWSYSPLDRLGPGPDVGMTIQEILDTMRADYANELVLQINHISDAAMSLLNLSGLVTVGAYRETDGVDPLSTYSEPMMLRLPYDGVSGLPMPWGTSAHTATGFTAVEIVIGAELQNNRLLETGLPQWFNLLNLGMILTATGNSDAHIIHRPIGLPRNYIVSDIDPADGLGGDFGALQVDDYARAINAHHVTVSAGPLVQLTATTDEGKYAEIGDIVTARKATFRVEVTAPSWAWFDTIEIFANTEPMPLDDDGVGIMRGTAEHAASFYEPYHRPWFAYEPVKSYRLRDGTLTSWSETAGVIHGVVEFEMEFNIDTWVVAVARGTSDTEGFRPLFPLVAHSFAEKGAQPELVAGFTIDDLYADPLLRVPAWGFTNPIFIDVDGDTNNDGQLFESLYVKRGWSAYRE